MIDRYSKLVRDKIPEIIEKQGDFPKTKTLNDGEYFDALNAKLREEVAEYLEDFSMSELADIAEVIHAIVKYKGFTLNDLEAIRQKKRKERGGFDARIALIEVERKT